MSHIHPMPLRLPAPVVVDDLVRLGRANDGGYVISARSIDESDVLIGLGINIDWSFEQDFLSRCPSASLIAVDGTVSTHRWRRELAADLASATWRAAQGDWRGASAAWQQARTHRQLVRDFGRFFGAPRRTFLPRMLGDDVDAGALTWEELARMVDGMAGPHTRWFVKMDIEGSEYRVLPAVLAHADRIAGMAIEFHDCDLFEERIEALWRRLDQHFVLVHAHGNNCGPLIARSGVPRVLEMSYVHRRLVRRGELERPNNRSYPLLGLDMPNDPNRADYPLQFEMVSSPASSSFAGSP